MHDELEAYLSQVAASDTYRVIEVVKESAYETTQRVVFVLPDGTEQGPYIRKIINVQHGVGFAYKTLFDNQQLYGPCPYVPYIHECAYEGDTLTVVMDYVQGVTLEQLIEKRGPGIEIALRYMPQICDAVQALHETFKAPLIHRDLKPSNIMITAHGVMLIDFGIARTFQKDAQQDTAYFGTKTYAPPEQYGFGQTSVKSDTYALGVILAYCITGDAEAATNPQHMSHYHIPHGLSYVITRASAFDPQKRFDSVRDFKRALRWALGLCYLTHKEPACLIPSQEAIGELSKTVVQRTWLHSEPSTVERVMDKIPYPLWFCWNVVVLFFYALSVVSVVQVYLQTLGDGFPSWVVTLFFMGYCMIVVHLFYFQLLYKRRLYGWLDAKGIAVPSFMGTCKRRWIAVVGAALAGYVSMLIAILVAQLVDMAMHAIGI